MPIIRIDMLEGRSQEIKERLARAMTDAMVQIAGSNPEQVTILINDVSPDAWCVAGETAAARAAARRAKAGS